MTEKWLRDAGTNPGLEIWRMDGTSEQISFVSKNQFGVFRSDDCYLVLNTSLNIETQVQDHQVHCWTGKSTKVQTRALQAANELSNALGNASLMTETQEHESELFASYFKQLGGLQYVEPVVLKKQVNHKEESWPVRLFHLKGKRQVRVRQVEVTHESLNEGDVFILDTENVIYQWNGASSSRMEKAKALDLTVRLRDERMNRLKTDIVIIESETDDNTAFWQALGGKGTVAAAESAGDDEQFEKEDAGIALYKMNVNSQGGDGQPLFNLERVDNGQPPTKNLLDSSKCFLLDCVGELFVWTGKLAPVQEKDLAMAFAQEYVKSNNRPSWTRITKAQDTAEPTLFKDRFKGQWKEHIDTPAAFQERKKQMVGGRTATVKQEKVNVDALHHPEKYAIAKEEDYEDIIFPSNQSKFPAELKIWHVQNSTKQELPSEEFGIFFEGESYIVLYTLRASDGSRKHVIYFWQGRHSCQDDKGHAALLATDLNKELRGNCVQARVVMNKEPEHFLSHFEGAFIVKKGRRDSPRNPTENSLYHVRGTNKINTHAVQTDLNATSLNSNDTFILQTPSKFYIWNGKGANQEERQTSAGLVDRLQPSIEIPVEIVEEGEEPSSFWDHLGGKAEYAHSERLQQGNISARLFHCSDASGTFRVKEVHNFSQDDLDDDDAMLLDTYDSVYVWLGKGCTKNEQDMSQDVALEYVRTADDGRIADQCPIYIITAGNEPFFFTSHFTAWDASGDDAYTRKLKKLAAAEGKVSATALQVETAQTTAAVQQLSVSSKEPVVDQKGQFYDVDRLRQKPWPEDVDPLRPENHLSPSQFEEVFKVNKDVFYAYPKWKQLNLKKNARLF